MNIKPLLNYITNFVVLTEAEEAFLTSKVIYRKYLKGQYILQQGDICKFQCFVISGCTKTFYVDDSGQEHIVMFSIADWWASDMGSYITQTPADYNIQCIDKTELIMFPYDVMEELFSEIPKLERFFRKIIERGLVASQKRVVRRFSLSAKDRYLYFRNQYPKIEKLIPQYMVASYLGITKEFLSKIKAQLLEEE
ncbi:Crp/Fnr family transcriptional regulator [Litoribaculum gwangyangense]|uniref:Crp/Fnr family transcriptional regulator n=1 Tax=Litoribaculum gwangyangense TaxID=1130722 RepID=A0ABP9CK74_9FLAO